MYGIRMNSNCLIIVAAANVLTELDVRNQTINTLNDRQAACRALAGGEIRSGIAEECVSRLTVLANSKRVTIYWVPGHQSVAGNENPD